MSNRYLALLILLMASCAKFETQQTSQALKPQTIFVATDRHDVGEGNNLKALVQTATQNRCLQSPSVYLIGGDNAGKGSMKDSLAMPVYSLREVRREIEMGAGTRDFTFLATFGSHDGGCTDSYSSFFSGPYSCNGLYIYGISYAQMCFAADSSATGYAGLDACDSFGLSASSASARFLRWVGSLEDSDPIIVMSHVPIHAHRADNPGGKIWADALNLASSRHDIFLLFGHNHTSEEMGSEPMPPMPEGLEIQAVNEPQSEGTDANVSIEQSYYFVLPGSKLPVQTADLNVVDTIQIRFAYMNAGYIKLGYASTISFSDENHDGIYDRSVVQRFTVNDTTITHFGSTSVPNPLVIDRTPTLQ